MARQPQALDYTSVTIADSAINIFGNDALVKSAPVGASLLRVLWKQLL